MTDGENPTDDPDDPIALGAFLSASSSELLDRTILDEPHLIAFRPVLHRLVEIFILCSCIGIVMLLHGKILLAPDLAGWMWLAASAASLWLIRLTPNIRREYFLSMVICSTSVLGWVALVADPMSSLVAFSNLVFITFLVLTLTPRAGFSMLLFTLVGLYAIRAGQMVLGIDAGLALPPLSWIEASQVGVIFVLHFISIWFLVNIIWVQKEHSRLAHLELEQSNAQLLSSEQARTVFLSTVTHELRTPLTSISGYADLMLAQPAKHPEGLAIVKRAATRLESLVDEFINLADPPNLASRMTLTVLRLERVVEDEVAAMQRHAKAQGTTLHFIALGSCAVQADPIRVAQVVSNLVENAIQHTPQGKSITVTLCTKEDWAVLKVEDTGAGISAEDLQHIFNPFFSKESAIKKRKGAGLGLTICKQIVEASRGDITVESRPGRSTIFTVRLPLAKDVPVRTASLMPAGERVLVLDDDPAILALMKATISSMGIAVETASNGPSALDLALQNHFDVIILDVNVPEMSGIEVSRRLRRAGSQAKIFLFSAMPAREAAAALVDAQADGLIPKPYHYDALIEKLRDAGLALAVS